MRRYLLTAIFVFSCSILMLEISLTKIFSVVLWYHFSYFVIALALFGIGIGGLVAYFVRELLDNRNYLLIFCVLCLVNSIVVLLALAFASNVNITANSGISKLLLFTVLFVLCHVPFAIFGFVVGYTFRLYPKMMNKIYAVDLIGSAFGCLIFVYLIWKISAPQIIIVCSILSILSGFLFYVQNNRLAASRVILVFVLPSLTILSMGFFTSIFEIRYTKTYEETEDKIYEKWSPLNRITVYKDVFWKDSPQSAFFWGNGAIADSVPAIEQLWVEQDAQAGTPITNFKGDFEEVDFLARDITSIPYYIDTVNSVYIIGAGGGRDVLTALLFKVEKIKGSEISPIIVGLVKNTYRTFAGGIYNYPNVDIEVSDARSAIRRSKDKYDHVQFSFIDSWAATMAGAFSLSENNLYTVEAFEDYLRHLSPNGVLSVSRYLFQPRNQTLRVVTTARAALEHLGIDRVKDHIVVVGKNGKNGVATTLIKTASFSSAELDSIASASKRLGFRVLYSWKNSSDKILSEAIEIDQLERFTSQYYYDVRPTLDDRPFFFQMTYFSNVFDLLLDKNKISGQVHNYYAHLVLTTLLFIGAGVLAAIYIISMVFRKRQVLTTWAVREPLPLANLVAAKGPYFLFIGLGFMLVEIPLIQYGSLYLEHPTYSFTIVLCSLLIGAGVGSYFSKKIDGDVYRSITRILATICILLILLSVSIQTFVSFTISYPLYLKALIMATVSGLIAVAMGYALPLGIRQLSQNQQNFIPFAWGINGGASVFGSILAMITSMVYGYTLCLIAGAVCYTIAAIASIMDNVVNRHP